MSPSSTYSASSKTHKPFQISEIGDVTPSRVKLQMREILLLLILCGKLQLSLQQVAVISVIGDVTSSRVKLQMREMILLLSLHGKLQ